LAVLSPSVVVVAVTLVDAAPLVVLFLVSEEEDP